MQRASPWLVRFGACLLLIAPFLPQSQAGGGPAGTMKILSGSGSILGGVERLVVGAGLLAPFLGGAFLLAGSSLPGGGPPALRLATLGLLLLGSFSLATLGSLLLTDVARRAVAPSFPLAVAMFTVPLLLSGIALARWMQGGLQRSTGVFERTALAVLFVLHGLFLADCGWDYLLLPDAVPNGIPPSSAGAWLGPLGGLIAAAGGPLSGMSPREAVDTADASG